MKTQPPYPIPQLASLAEIKGYPSKSMRNMKILQRINRMSADMKVFREAEAPWIKLPTFANTTVKVFIAR